MSKRSKLKHRAVRLVDQRLEDLRLASEADATSAAEREVYEYLRELLREKKEV